MYAKHQIRNTKKGFKKMNEWSYLPISLWELIPLWDGRTVAYARAVCKNWQRGIEKNEKLMHLYQLHYVRIDDPSRLDEELKHGYPRNAKFKRVSVKKGAKLIDKVLWNDCGINRYRLPDGYRSRLILHQFGWRGGDETYHVEKRTHDLLIVNNHYFYNTMKQILDTDLFYISGMDHLSYITNGIVDWRLIHFPEHSVSALGREFHCGWCWLVRIKISDRVMYYNVDSVSKMKEMTAPYYDECKNEHYAAQVIKKRSRLLKHE